MNLPITALILLLLLEFTNSFSKEGSSTTKLNKISFKTRTTLYGNDTERNAQSDKPSSTFSRNSKLKPNKWKIGRVTKRQYGIVNILWQKTKVFIEQDHSNVTCKATTIEMSPGTQVPITVKSESTNPFEVKIPTSTASYIEFYYLYQADDRKKLKRPSNAKLAKFKSNHTNVHHSNNKKAHIPAFLKIHMHTFPNQAPRPTTLVRKTSRGIYRNKLNKSQLTTPVLNTLLTVITKAKVYTRQRKKLRSQQSINILTNSTIAGIKIKRKEYTSEYNSDPKEAIIGTSNNMQRIVIPASSTAYDKVKFFELYDNNTPKWPNYIHNNLTNAIYSNSNKDVRDDEQILLHHVNEDIGYQQDKNKTRFVKKHIQDLYRKEGKSHNKANITKYFSGRDWTSSLNTSELHVNLQSNVSSSRPAVWSEFPFVAVYIYEPLHIHCDAAGISPHWLVAAASCLSRYRSDFRGGGLTAFVTFCGESWRYPQMISYVRRTLIHPMYRPRDSLRHLFNAGLIQVVNSMAEICSGWAPVSLMSHHIIGGEISSIGTAVGWGLDRYDESYSVRGIPNHPLMIYESRLYSQTCPGSSDFSAAKTLDELGTSNVYCLLLPPYLAEENDTVHGALLLIGGKLLALYLKEERRRWGAQTAQYAGVWRLLPWLTETAREPDESFQFDL